MQKGRIARLIQRIETSQTIQTRCARMIKSLKLEAKTLRETNANLIKLNDDLRAQLQTLRVQVQKLADAGESDSDLSSSESGDGT